VGCYIWYSEEGPGQAGAPPSPLLVVPNVTGHPLTASVPITILLYDGPLLCGFNVAIKWLTVIHACLVYNSDLAQDLVVLEEHFGYSYIELQLVS